MKTDQYAQSSELVTKPPIDENDEGGLNLVELKETIFRQFPIIIGVASIVIILAFMRARTRTPVFQANFEILSEPVNVETKVSSTDSQSRDTLEEIVAVELDEVQLKILESPRIILPVVEELKQNYPEIDYQSVVSDLEIEIDKTQRVLTVTYEYPNEQRVQAVLDLLSQAYLDYSLEKRQSGINRGIKFLEEQLPQIDENVEKWKQRLQALRQEYNLIDPESQGAKLTDRLAILVAQEQELTLEVSQKKLMSANLKKELAQNPTNSFTATEFDNSYYNDILDKLKDIDSQIAEKSVIFSNQSRQIQNLREQQEELKSLLVQEGRTVQNNIDNEIRLLENQKLKLNRQIEDTKVQIQELSIVTRKYNDIERQLENATRKLDEFVTQINNLKIDAAQKETPWKLLTTVSQPVDTAPGTINYLVLGTILGLLLGVGIAVILEKYDNTIYTSAQVQEIAHLPLLGIIPFDKKQKKLSFSKKISNLVTSSEYTQPEATALALYTNGLSSWSLISSSVEAFRFFAANLGLYEPDSNTYNTQSIIVTSAISGEGKSTVAFNAAKAVAATRRKVLVVDTDMRVQNQLTLSLGMEYDRGLREFLLEDNLDCHELIQRSCWEDNLYIFPSGGVDAALDPSRLLASQKMRDLMEDLKAHFDLIIYDVSSIMEFADVSLLASKTDGVVLVTGLGKLQSLTLKEALNLLKMSHIPILGIVINKVSPK